MCGIIGVVGKKNAEKVLIDGLKKLEYRGYDSAGIAFLNKKKIKIVKAVGHVKELDEKVTTTSAQTGIGHTRWATHGEVSKVNSHPHTNTNSGIAVVHNGIIDNHTFLRKRLEVEGKVFLTDTDTEVIPLLIESYYEGDPVEAVRKAMLDIQGTYGIAVVFEDHPMTIVTAKMGSPIIIGIGKTANYVSSDALALIQYTDRVIHLEDGSIAKITQHNVKISDIVNESDKIHEVETLDKDDFNIELSSLGFPNYMIKEIFEQPAAVNRCIAGRLDENSGNALLGGLKLSRADIPNISRLCFVGAGTSLHAAIIASRIIEEFSRVSSRAYSSADIIDTNPMIKHDDMWFAISQSGETYDTLQAIREVSLKARAVKGIINIAGSTIARECGAGIYIHSGREVSVASTKAFTSQLAALSMIALKFARSRHLTQEAGKDFVDALKSIPLQIEECLRVQEPVKLAALKIKDAKNVMFIGRGISEYVAKEGALKLKEISYIPCDAYSGAELKHGPIAMLEKGTPVVAVIPDDDVYERTLSNIHEAKARGAFIITVGSKTQEVIDLSDINIPLPISKSKFLSPFLTIIPLQLLAYYVTLELGYDVDKPRNLAKSVTVG